MKKYLTTGYNTSIKEVEILRETGSSVYFPASYYGKKKEKHVLKMSSFHQYHDTWAQAHDYLLECARQRVARTERQLNHETETLKKIEAMKEDTCQLKNSV